MLTLSILLCVVSAVSTAKLTLVCWRRIASFLSFLPPEPVVFCFSGTPDADGRHEILQIKAKKMRLSAEVDMRQIADDTHGYAGADLGQAHPIIFTCRCS